MADLVAPAPAAVPPHAFPAGAVQEPDRILPVISRVQAELVQHPSLALPSALR